MDSISRREFVFRAGAAALAASPLGAGPIQRALGAPPAGIRVGCAAITWGGRDLEAMDDIAAAGYPGIQLRASVLSSYAGRPAALAEDLARRKLTFVALSSGNLRIDPAVEAEEIATHTGNARFLKDAGGLYLQVIDSRPKDRPVTPSDYVRLGRLMTELGKRTADLGIPLAYHHHMNSIGEPPEAIAQIVQASDPRYVKLLFDTAHYQQGGGDPVRAIRQYADRLGLMHLKDLESPVSGATGDLSRSYRFMELGRGKVDLKGVFAALGDIKFHGWAVVELDAVPDKARTPKESALISRKYLEDVIGLHV